MATIQCDVFEIDMEDDRGKSVPGVRAECEECEHATESYGTGSGSIKRCLALLREECPGGENNYYKEF